MDLLIRAFLILVEVGVFQCIDCLFVSGSYWKVQVSLHVITFFNKFGCSFIICRISEQMLLRLSFWSSLRFVGTILAQTLFMFKLLCTICQTVSLSTFNISAIIRILRRRSFSTIWSTFSSVFFFTQTNILLSYFKLIISLKNFSKSCSFE